MDSTSFKRKARAKFTLNEWVVLSAKGRRAFRYSRSPRQNDMGFVTGFGRSDYTVKVRIDRLLTSQSYHVAFWTPARLTKYGKRKNAPGKSGV